MEDMSALQQTNCGFYQLGYNTQLLMALAEEYWYLPDRGRPFPEMASSVVGEINLAAELAATHASARLRARLREVRRRAEGAWASIRGEWYSMHRLIAMEILECDPEHPPAGAWWDSMSPLLTPPFRELKRTLRRMSDTIDADRRMHLEAGRVIAQVASLPQNEVEQDPKLGERFPIPRLRLLLNRLRSTNLTLCALDFYIPEAYSPIFGLDYVGYVKREARSVHYQIVQTLQAPGPPRRRGLSTVY